MKCKYCYAELKQGAKFCPFCGKKVLEQEKCVKCGEQIKAGALFCPYCGSKQRVEEKVELVVVEELIPTDKRCIYCGEEIEADSMFCPFCGKSQEVDEVKAEEPQQEPSQDISEQDSSKEDIQPIEEHVYENEEEEGKSMSWLWVLVVLLIAGGIGAWYYLSGGFPLGGSNQMAETPDTVSIEIDDSSTRVEFIEAMYKDFFENNDFDNQNINSLHKYLSSSVAEKLKMECPYDGCEGEFSYVVDFFCDGSLSYERPDYGDKVVKRDIHSIDHEWFEVSNVWDVIQTPVKVRLQVKPVDGAYKIVDIRVDENNISTINTVGEEDFESSIENGISIEDAIIVAENMIIEKGDYKGLKSLKEINNIMLNKYGYKREDRYYSDREWDFSPLYYKNCIFASSVKDGNNVIYGGAPIARGEGISSFVGFDKLSDVMVIAPFTKSVFNSYIKEIERLGGQKIETDAYTLKAYRISTFKEGAFGIDYCITIGKD